MIAVRFIFIFCFLTVGLSGQANIEEKKGVVSEKTETTTESPSVFSDMVDVLGMTASSVVSAPGFLADGVIYALGGTGVIVASCGPLMVAAALGAVQIGPQGSIRERDGLSPQNSPTCLPIRGVSFKNLERLHPHLGTSIWRRTKDWRGRLEL